MSDHTQPPPNNFAHPSALSDDEVKLLVDRSRAKFETLAASRPDPGPDLFFTVKIPAAMAHYSDDIRRFVDAMVYKLERNAHKGKWESLTVDQAFKLLEGEVEELRREIGGNSVKTILEAADVANFALMVANIAVERGK